MIQIAAQLSKGFVVFLPENGNRALWGSLAIARSRIVWVQCLDMSSSGYVRASTFLLAQISASLSAFFRFGVWKSFSTLGQRLHLISFRIQKDRNVYRPVVARTPPDFWKPESLERTSISNSDPLSSCNFSKISCALLAVSKNGNGFAHLLYYVSV